ncbi:sporulation histidine kinase inhibitor Sda [Paenibacillus polymyxa]|uniref:sporulation histidine kinase inhibitor Sda n=1 Tax=Paenibacillus polymyxa TaxID=1406 RepID=UPI0012DB3294
MAMLTDEMLLDSYQMAIELKLECDFIALLLAEIHKKKVRDEYSRSPSLDRTSSRTATVKSFRVRMTLRTITATNRHTVKKGISLQRFKFGVKYPFLS